VADVAENPSYSNYRFALGIEITIHVAKSECKRFLEFSVEQRPNFDAALPQDARFEFYSEGALGKLGWGAARCSSYRTLDRHR